MESENIQGSTWFERSHVGKFDDLRSMDVVQICAGEGAGRLSTIHVFLISSPTSTGFSGEMLQKALFVPPSVKSHLTVHKEYSSIGIL